MQFKITGKVFESFQLKLLASILKINKDKTKSEELLCKLPSSLISTITSKTCERL